MMENVFLMHLGTKSPTLASQSFLKLWFPIVLWWPCLPLGPIWVVYKDQSGAKIGEKADYT